MKQFYLLLLVKVVSSTLLYELQSCYTQNGLLEGENMLYYSVRCRSFKSTLTCISEVADSHYLSWYQLSAIEDTKTFVGNACALARNQYCSAIYLDGKMKSCAVSLDKSSLNNLTKEYAYVHYGSLATALNCMTREVQVCPDDEHIQTYLRAIRTWRSELDHLTDGMTAVVSRTLPPHLQPAASTLTYGATVNGGTLHFSTIFLVVNILYFLF